MQSSLIGKIEKAHRYAEEPERISIHEFRATFQGGNGDYEVGYADGDGWRCTCNFCQTWSYCSHTMALEKTTQSNGSDRQSAGRPFGQRSGMRPAGGSAGGRGGGVGAVSWDRARSDATVSRSPLTL